MIFIQSLEDSLHNGLSVEYRLGRDLELAAIFIYCCHLFFIEIDDLTMGALESLPLLVHEVRANYWTCLLLRFLCCHNLFYSRDKDNQLFRKETYFLLT